MKIVFIAEDQDSKEYKTDTQDLKRIIQIADNLSDSELEKMKQAIERFSTNIAEIIEK